MNNIETMKMALEALEVANSCIDGYYIPKGKTHLPEVESAITALRQAIEQAQQAEPVAWMSPNKESFVHAEDVGNSVPNWTDYYTIPLYTTPPPRHPLTIEKIDWLYESTESVNWGRSFARAIEAAHGIKEKNNV